MSNSIPVSERLFQYLLWLADTSLIHGHRLSEWCRHGPTIEEDMALANIALDCLGQAKILLEYAAQAEGKNRSADDLCFFRSADEFRNIVLVELPDDLDFAKTIAKQFVLDIWQCELFTALQSSCCKPLADFSAKAVKEVTYHARHSSTWVIRLGDGTDESHQRIQECINAVWPYTPELFFDSNFGQLLHQEKIAVLQSSLMPAWQKRTTETLVTAGLDIPPSPAPPTPGRNIQNFASMLKEMQELARAHPGARW